jgi:DNA polymerase-1
MSSLYLVDGSNFLFRAFHAMPMMVSSKGVPTGAVRGFASMLLRLIGEHKPTHLAVVFDAGGKDKRAEKFPAYKQNRGECPVELVPQFDLASQLVTAMGVVCLQARDAEADDVIATLARRAERSGEQVVIVSSDKDLMQLCRDGAIALLDTMKEEGRGKLFGEAEVVEKWGVPPRQLGDLLALVGDSSDNLPGIPGVGPKTAAQLLQMFGSLDELIARRDEVNVRGKDKIIAALRDHEAQLRLVRELVALDEDLAGLPAVAELTRQTVEPEKLIALLKELEFTTLYRRLVPRGGCRACRICLPPPLRWSRVPLRSRLRQLSPDGDHSDGASAAQRRSRLSAVTTASPSTGSATFDLAAASLATAGPIRVLLDEAELRTELSHLSQRLTERDLLAIVPAWCEDGHTGHHARLSPLCGLALATTLGPPLYLPFAHRYLGSPTQPSRDTVLSLLRPLLTNPQLPKAVYGAKETQQALRGLGISLLGILTDPSLCSYLLDAADDHSLAALVTKHLPDHPPLLERKAVCQAGKQTLLLDAVEIGRAAELLGREARATLLLGGLLYGRLDAAAQRLLGELELPLATVLADIEGHGICLDTSVLAQLSSEVATKLDGLETEIEKVAGTQVNLNSPKQLAELLFGKLGLPPMKKTKGKTGLSVDAEVLEALAADFPVAQQILEHRSLSKLKGTYIDALPLLVSKQTGRLHTTYQQLVAATGRLSSTDPNLQNIPIRSELGQKIRAAFVAAPGNVLIAADYSQIELRVLAHLSGDPLLVESFRAGEDVHTRTAIEMFGPEEGKLPDKRRAAKMINYGIVYGLTDFGLATRLSIERRLAKKYIEEYFARYHGVRTFMDELVRRAKAEGGARTLRGRFRPLPDLTNKNFPLRGYAERMAKNTPIQGTAADILKQAMIDVQRLLIAQEPEVRMLLTVHDELVLEAPIARKEAVCQAVKQTMERAETLSVPLVVDVGAAPNWSDC